MFVIPRKSKSSVFSSKRYEGGGNIVYDSSTTMSDIERKYTPYIKQLNELVKEINSDIYSSKRKAKELADLNAKKAVDIEIESAKNRASLYTTKMNTIKAMTSLYKEIKELEMKERKLLFDLTGKNVDTKGGGSISQKEHVAAFADMRPSDVTRSIHAIPSYNIDLSKPESAKTEEEKMIDGSATIQPGEAIAPIEDKKKVDEQLNSATQSNIAKIEEGVKDTKFASIFAPPTEPDTANHIIGNEHVEDYDKFSHKFSYSTAETALVGKFKMNTQKKCHYDEEMGIGWIRTYDTDTGTLASSETIVSPEYHGVFHIANSGGVKYAIDEVENNYDIVPDKFDNAPEEIKEELLRVNRIYAEDKK